MFEMAAVLIDTYLNRYQFREHHQIDCAAEPLTCFDAARNIDMSASTITCLLLRLRGLPTSDLRLQAFLENMKFTWLAEDAPREFVIGFGLKSTLAIDIIDDQQAFIDGCNGYTLKCVWNFRCQPIAPMKTRVSTETRILCLTQKRHYQFLLYWLAIRPFSGLIRREMLRLIKAKAEELQRKSPV